MLTKHLLPVLVAFCIFSRCTQNVQPPSFYQFENRGHDVLRLPLVEPYDLITAYCCQGWNFSGGSRIGKDFGLGLAVDSANILPRHIVLWSPDNGGAWFSLNRLDKSAREFSQRAELNAYLSEYDTVPLYSSEAIYRGWKSTGQLPWAKLILFPPAAASVP